jgi:hypothetical protein
MLNLFSCQQLYFTFRWCDAGGRTLCRRWRGQSCCSCRTRVRIHAANIQRTLTTLGAVEAGCRVRTVRQTNAVAPWSAFITQKHSLYCVRSDYYLCGRHYIHSVSRNIVSRHVFVKSMQKQGHLTWSSLSKSSGNFPAWFLSNCIQIVTGN